MRRTTYCFLLILSTPALGEVVTYAPVVFPDEDGWERRLADTYGADRWIENGWLFHFVDQPDGWPGVFGNAEFYRRSIADFAGCEAFFVEWRAETDAPSSILESSGTPVVVSAAGASYAVYHTTMTDARVQLFRDTFIPLVFLDIQPDVPHTYRVELRGISSYAWYIDGEIVDSGIPIGPYPTESSFLIWGVRRHTFDATTRWQYLRYGTIPLEGTGDYNSDGILCTFDLYFFHECLSSGAPGDDAGPGCRFADMDSDTDVDLHDFALFQNAFTGAE